MSSERLLKVAGTFAAIGVVPTELDFVNNVLKAALAVAVAIVAYFLRGLGDQIKNNTRELARQKLLMERHSIMFQYWLAQAKGELEARGNDPGRRKADSALLNLLNAIQDTELEGDED